MNWWKSMKNNSEIIVFLSADAIPIQIGVQVRLC